MKKKTISVLLALLLTVCVLPLSAMAVLPEGVPSALEAPTVQTIEVMTDESGVPYFRTIVTIPESVLQLDADRPGDGAVFYEYSLKIDDGEWGAFGGGGYLDLVTDSEEAQVPGSAGTYYFEFDAIDEGSIDEIDIKEHVYAYRIQVYYDYYEGWPDVEPIYSPASNEVSIGSVSYYSAASEWAEPWLEKAEEYDLIPECLLGDDMTQPITRAEFAALSVKLYESMSGKTAQPVPENQFTDTNDAEILKAVNIGITNGTSATTFSPNDLITREQTATMLTRAYKAAFWAGWTLAGDASYTAHTLDYSGVPTFADDASISAYAKASVYFMVKHHILDGMGNNMFAPNTSDIPVGAAINYGRATREQAIKIAVASKENLG
jgi:hypothetical protein